MTDWRKPPPRGQHSPPPPAPEAPKKPLGCGRLAVGGFVGCLGALVLVIGGFVALGFFLAGRIPDHIDRAAILERHDDTWLAIGARLRDDASLAHADWPQPPPDDLLAIYDDDFSRDLYGRRRVVLEQRVVINGVGLFQLVLDGATTTGVGLRVDFGDRSVHPIFRYWPPPGDAPPDPRL